MKNILISTLLLGFIILSSAFTQKVFAQDSISNYKSLDIHIMPLIFYYPRIRLGIEYQSVTGLGFSVDIGFADGFIKGDGYELFEFRPEIKYYFKQFSPKVSMYTSVEGFYLNMKLPQEPSIYYPEAEPNNVITADRAVFNMTKLGYHLKGGINVMASKRLEFDFYVGPGMAIKEIRYTDVVNPKVEFNPHNTFDRVHGNEGKQTVLHLTAGCKVGYLIWRK